MNQTDNPFFLTGKMILVTGASSGIGRAAAIMCSKMGAKVIVTGRNEERLQETLRELDGDGHLSILADLTDADSRKSLVEQIPALDGIVHCAGIGHRQLAKSVTIQEVNSIMNVNFSSAVMLQAELIAGKKVNKRASIVFLSSRAADIPAIANSLYSASKAALQSYAKCLALELAPRLIRVNCICPAMVWTPFIQSGLYADVELSEEEKKYPLKRYGQPEDVANLAVFLLSDASSWMTGSCIDITGGSIQS